MLFRIAADLIVLFHFVFILFVLFGSILLFKWRWLVWLHIPSVIWGSLAIMLRWICPLTPLENWLRYSAGEEFYTGSFIERYLMPVIYPSELHQNLFVVMGAGVIIVNLIVYSIWLGRRHK
ncbi:MAG: DUF2784 domain-containing protein [Gammaproteobacteria bacterium]|nr:DUF2784 domain-containing protein [Gammaproteobacteria bacterium]